MRDLWPLTLLEVGGHSPHHPFVRLMAWAERLGYEKCDHTVSLLHGARNYMVAHGLAADKFAYISNGIDPEAAQRQVEELPAEHRRMVGDLKERGALIILYSGSHGIVNALDNVIEAAGLLRDEPAAHFLLVGQGPEKDSLQGRAQRTELRDIAFLPSLSRS